MNKEEYPAHVDADSLVAPDAITQPQGHRRDYNCSFCKFNKKNSKSHMDMEISPHQVKIRRNDCRCGGILFGG